MKHLALVIQMRLPIFGARPSLPNSRQYQQNYHQSQPLPRINERGHPCAQGRIQSLGGIEISLIQMLDQKYHFSRLPCSEVFPNLKI